MMFLKKKGSASFTIHNLIKTFRESEEVCTQRTRPENRHWMSVIFIRDYINIHYSLLHPQMTETPPCKEETKYKPDPETEPPSVDLNSFKVDRVVNMIMY